MGCSESTEIPEDAYVKTNSNPPESGCFTDEYFNQEQKRLVKESWILLDNNYVEKGMDIFLRIFKKRPDAKQLFPFRDLEGDELLKDTRFRGHSKRFMSAVGSTVVHLDALDVSCVPTLVQLGRRHAMLTNFLNSYMDTFVEAIEEVFENELGPAQTPEVRDAWAAVFRFITSKIEEGYHDAISKNPKQIESVPLQTKEPEPISVIEQTADSGKDIDVDLNGINVTCPAECQKG